MSFMIRVMNYIFKDLMFYGLHSRETNDLFFFVAISSRTVSLCNLIIIRSLEFHTIYLQFCFAVFSKPRESVYE